MADFISDNNSVRYLLYAQKQNLFPEYVETSPLLEAKDVEGLNKVAFADPDRREYPCHTDYATWLSACYFASSGCDNKEIRARIEKQAAYHKISDDIKTLFDTFSKFVKSAAAPQPEEPIEKFAFVIDFAGAAGKNKVGYYPINNLNEMYKSADEATEDYLSGNLEPTEFISITEEIVKAAAEIGVPATSFEPIIGRYGARNLPEFANAHSGAFYRGLYNAEAGDRCKAALAEAEELFQKSATFDEGVKIGRELAMTYRELDKEYNIPYMGNIADPFTEICVGMSESTLNKYASQSVRIADVFVPAVDFVNLDVDSIVTDYSKNTIDLLKEAKTALQEGISKATVKQASTAVAQLDSDVQLSLLEVLQKTAW